MAIDISRVRIGGLAVSYGGSDIGLTSYDTATEFDTNELNPVDVKAGRYGSTPLDQIGNGRSCEVKVALIETSPSIIALAIPGATVSGTRVTVGNPLGLSARSLAQELRLTFVSAGVLTTEAFVIPLASPKFANNKVTMKGDKVVEFTAVFQAWLDTDINTFYYFDTAA
jgi:hypothetical protein